MTTNGSIVVAIDRRGDLADKAHGPPRPVLIEQAIFTSAKGQRYLFQRVDHDPKSSVSNR